MSSQERADAILQQWQAQRDKPPHKRVLDVREQIAMTVHADSQQCATALRCEYLFCQKAATTRLTVPHHQPRFFACDECTKKMLIWSHPYRHVPGMVQLENIGGVDPTPGRRGIKVKK